MQNPIMRNLLIALVALLPLVVTAQEDERDDLPRWYQIELLIFAQNRVNTEEMFRENPFSLEENSILSQALSINALLNLQPDGNPIPLEINATDDLTAEPSPLTVAETSNTAPETKTVNDTEAIDVDIPQAVEVPPFIAALESERVLNEHHEKLRRRSAYRVLWHSAWQQALDDTQVNTYALSAGRLLLQPEPEPEPKLTPELASPTTDTLDSLLEQLLEAPADTATDIAISNLIGTATIADVIEGEAQRLVEAQAIITSAPPSFRELQGSLKIYKTRFAHISLDLWYTQIDETVPGLNLPQLIIHEQPPKEPTAERLVDEIDAVETPVVSAQDFLEADDLVATIIKPQEALTPRFEMRYELAYEPGLYGHIEENRRLRPEELYYIDHPLFGAIIKMVEVPHPQLRSEQILEENTDPLAF